MQSAVPLLAAVLAVWSAVPVIAQTPTEPPPALPVIVANGEAIIKRAPDRAWLTVVTETRDSRADEARRRSAQIMTDVQSAIRRAGISEDAIRTTGFSLLPEMNYDDGRGEIRGYVVRNQIEVQVDDLNRLGQVIDAAGTRSNTGLSIIGPRFGLKDELSAETEALRQAVRAARARAEAMAAGAGRSLGPIVRIEEHPDVRPFPPRPEMMTMRMASAADTQTPITPGEIEVRAAVTLSAEIR
jgi:uncharacterized protein YggE